MKGLALSRRYYDEVFLPECEKRLPDAVGHFAAGLVGEGSECFGYDDALSRDHGFGPRLCIWLTREDDARWGRDLDALWQSLPTGLAGYERPAAAANEGKRSGVFTVEEFYQRLLGVPDAPDSPDGWLSIGEPYLAAAVNGAVYRDEPGRFTAVRERLLAHFPDDVTRYYLARHAAIAAQTGQYNLLRAHRHGEELAVSGIKARFIQSVIAMVFLLNRRYRPFYKWAPRAMRALPVLGSDIHDRLLKLSRAREIGEQCTLVEEICASVLTQLRRQGYTAGQSDYLMDHLPELVGRIADRKLREWGISLAF